MTKTFFDDRSCSYSCLTGMSGNTVKGGRRQARRGVAFSRAAGAGQLDMVAAEICELRKQQQQLCS